MGACCSNHETVEVVIENDARAEIETWNHQREEVIKNIDALQELYFSIERHGERYQLIETNLHIFEKFFNIPPGDNIFTRVEYMFQVGLQRYIKPAK
jgi:hypothetical protein